MLGIQKVYQLPELIEDMLPVSPLSSHRSETRSQPETNASCGSGYGGNIHCAVTPELENEIHRAVHVGTINPPQEGAKLPETFSGLPGEHMAIRRSQSESPRGATNHEPYVTWSGDQNLHVHPSVQHLWRTDVAMPCPRLHDQTPGSRFRAFGGSGSGRSGTWTLRSGSRDQVPNTGRWVGLGWTLFRPRKRNGMERHGTVVLE